MGSSAASALGLTGYGSTHFPTEQAALKCLYLVVRSLDPTGERPKRETAGELGSRWLVVMPG